MSFIKLAELVHIVSDDTEKTKSELVSLDNFKKWKWTDIDHLISMGFEQNGDFYMALANPPLVVYQTNNDGFHLIDKRKKEHKVFPKFNQMIEHFDSYKQDFDF